MRHRPLPSAELGFQIAPMVDVIFLLILFFMACAGSVRVESELALRLPGALAQSGPLPMIEEQIIEVSAAGVISLNGQVLGEADDPAPAALRATLGRFRELAELARIPAQVVIAAAPAARYERTVTVLDACAAAGLTHVTFADSEEF